ncbi:Glycerate dehydrogenase [Nocardioides dokdonensis FR1436]|uniref:Glycerate dehydrogenase n=1 Tax=Nocardioides dokdonensis FR1436 TaxID=1300347 RepID=A0A1A9GKP3_9ACTN|nr:C-terminal binding protein [Nocardioides dokdonensis]ANH38250.1 Glycerate dehydrogenase [Nocardioides dokdonensis FR1436]
MSRPVAVYTDVTELDPAPGVALLEQAGFEVRVLDESDPDRVAALAADASVLLIGYSVVDAALLDRLPQLRLVCTQSAGVDTVDLAAAAARGVQVAHVPDGATDDVAGHALAMALALVRGLPFLDRQVREGQWDGTSEPLRRLSSVRLGVVGMGRIGRRLATMALPLFGEVVGHDPVPGTQHWPDGVRSASFDDLLAEVDVLSLHLPLTDGTRSLLGAPQLARMRPDALLVNVSRGGLVDHDALLAALDDGRLAGAALDVLPVEPPPADSVVLRHPRVLLTPHAAYLSPDSAAAYVRTQAENAVAWRDTGRALHVVGPAPGPVASGHPG